MKHESTCNHDDPLNPKATCECWQKGKEETENREFLVSRDNIHNVSRIMNDDKSRMMTEQARIMKPVNVPTTDEIDMYVLRPGNKLGESKIVRATCAKANFAMPVVNELTADTLSVSWSNWSSEWSYRSVKEGEHGLLWRLWGKRGLITKGFRMPALQW